MNRIESNCLTGEVKAVEMTAGEVASIQTMPMVYRHLTPRQFRQALNRLLLRTMVETAIAAADQDTKDWYFTSTYFDRKHPVTIAMATTLGKTAADLDAVWALGETL